MKAEGLSLGCEALEEFRKDFDYMLKSIVKEMTIRDLKDGTISAKIKVTMETGIDITGQVNNMLSIEPDVSMKIGSSGKLKGRKQNGLFLQYTKDGAPVIGESQVSIDEYIRKAEADKWNE